MRCLRAMDYAYDLQESDKRQLKQTLLSTNEYAKLMGRVEGTDKEDI